MEADANSWLTLRGSVSHNIYGASEIEGVAGATGELEGTEIAGSTAIGVGATLNFGKLKVDGAFSLQSDDGAETRVGLHYWF